MPYMRTFCGALLFLFVIMAPEKSSANPAERLVSDFQSGLVGVMQEAAELGVSGRYQRLEPIIKQTFHLGLMAGLAAGPHWKTATAEQRQRLVTAFTRMSIATLATLFNGYSGERFDLVGHRPGPQAITLVDTELVVPGRNSNVAISYVARDFNGHWRLIDVIVDGGISELKVRISEYRQTLNQGGIEALIKLLNDKADDLLS